LADEYGKFTLTEEAMVRFGNETAWVDKLIPANEETSCSIMTFGSDPVPGGNKACYIAGSSTAPPPSPSPAPSPTPPPSPSPSPSPSGGRVAYYGNPRFYYPPDAVRVPPSDKGSIQGLVDQGKKIRLDVGDYTGIPDLILKTGAEIYCCPKRTRLGRVHIGAGSDKALLKGAATDGIIYDAGDPITETVLGMVYGDISSTGAKIERGMLASIGGRIDWDAGADGWHRNNRVIRQRTHNAGFNGDFPHFKLKGGPGRTSWGNVALDGNVLGTWYAGYDISGQKDFSLSGLDEEDYQPQNHKSGHAAVYVRDVGTFNLMAANGTLDGCADAVDSAADNNNLIFSDLKQNGQGPQRCALRFVEPMKKAALWKWRADGGVDDQTSGSMVLIDPRQVTDTARAVELLCSDIANSTAWGFPDLSHPIDDPVGTLDPASQPDMADELQAIVNGALECDVEGKVYWLERPVKIKREAVVTGVAGKTAFVSKNPGMPCFETGFEANGQTITASFLFIDVVFQGGLVGYGQNEPGVQANEFGFINVTFRDIGNGTDVGDTYAWDNGWSEHCTFYRCGAGMRQRGLQGGSTENNIGYIDKTNSLRNRYIECDYGIDWWCGRANNLNGFTECDFYKCRLGAFLLQGGHNVTKFNNCRFYMCGGKVMCEAGSNIVVYVHCHWVASPETKAFVSPQSYVEGGTADPNGTDAVLFGPNVDGTQGWGLNAMVHNMESKAKIGVPEESWLSVFAVNSNFAGQPEWSKPIAYRHYDSKSSHDTGDDTWEPVKTVLDGTSVPGTRFLREWAG
jgi:hypothetical protein